MYTLRWKKAVLDVKMGLTELVETAKTYSRRSCINIVTKSPSSGKAQTGQLLVTKGLNLRICKPDKLGVWATQHRRLSDCAGTHDGVGPCCFVLKLKHGSSRRD